jgi:hypothetical protein
MLLKQSQHGKHLEVEISLIQRIRVCLQARDTKKWEKHVETVNHGTHVHVARIVNKNSYVES